VCRVLGGRRVFHHHLSGLVFGFVSSGFRYVVSDEISKKQVQELLERIADPNILKLRVKFYSFKEFVK